MGLLTTAVTLGSHLQRGLELSVAWGLRAGVLEHAVDGPLQLTPRALAALAVAGLALVRAHGLLPVLLFPVMSLAWVARMVLGAYQALNILVDLGLGASILVFLIVEDRFHRLFSTRISPLRDRLKAAESYADFRRVCLEVDREEGTDKWREEERDLPQAVLLRRTIEELEEALRTGNLAQLKFLLGGVFRRNHLGVDSVSLHNRCLSGTKHLLDRYQEKLRECLHFITSSTEMSKAEKEAFLRAARRSLGRTALCLSGGGSIAMYHLGVIRALIESGLFRYMKVITGASGGSILAALLATKTEQELLAEVLTETFSTDFKGDGQMKAQRIEWFFKLRRFPIARLLLHKGVLDKDAFERTVAFYIGDMTFAEAFQRTGRHVTISVSSSSLAGYSGAEELLLNHLTTPNVLIRSAVVASCSLPGILKPSKLLSKNTEGQIGPFYLNGVQWIDGSIQADIPFRGISTMFSVSNCIVSQVNFHVVPFLADEQTRSLHKNWYWSIFKMLATDISYRASALQQLGLFPTFFGQDISGVFKQTYSGQVTIIPPFRLLDSWGTNAILVPGREGIRYYLETGKRSCWKHLTHIKYVMAIEIQLARCIAALSTGAPLPMPSHRRSPTLAETTHMHNNPTAAGGGGGSGRQLSFATSFASVGDLEDDEISISTWSTAAAAGGAGNGNGNGNGGGIGAEAGDRHEDDDLVVPEFKFVSKPRASKRYDAPPVPAADGAGATPSPVRRARQLSAAAGETLLSALSNRLAWLERENQKLTEQLTRVIGTMEHGHPFILDEAGLRAALSSDDEDEDEGGSSSNGSGDEDDYDTQLQKLQLQRQSSSSSSSSSSQRCPPPPPEVLIPEVFPRPARESRAHQRRHSATG